ncbi:hypothetical protein AVEN_173271-1 [Araneus ventricosus]|uniref:Uncharacterized protein n=1 Tax=Araneus ventricosus TaxID=182803 RepID=A0A4Y2W3A4_ARAVE|nr:hypothetical protein AVEN_173271-1 [Araneus ventricosus]
MPAQGVSSMESGFEPSTRGPRGPDLKPRPPRPHKRTQVRLLYQIWVLRSGQNPDFCRQVSRHNETRQTSRPYECVRKKIFHVLLPSDPVIVHDTNHECF